MPINPNYNFLNDMADFFRPVTPAERQSPSRDAIEMQNMRAPAYNPPAYDVTQWSRLPPLPQKPQPATPYIPSGVTPDVELAARMGRAQQPQQRPAPRPQPRPAPQPSFPIPEATQEPSSLVERSQMTEQDLPPEAPQGMRITPPEQGMRIEPPTDFGDMRDDRLDQTTLAQRGRDMGFDPRQLMVALAQFSAGMGNIKGKDTASTAKDFYKMQLGIEQQQRDNDFKMEDMARRYAPKPQREDPLMGLKQQMLQSQVEGQKNKVKIDAELNDPKSERSITARKMLRTYLYQSSTTKLNPSEVEKLVDESMTAAAIYKMMPMATAGVSQFNAADSMTQRLQTEAAEKEKNRQAQMALEQERQRGRMQTQAAKPLPQAKGTKGTVPAMGGSPEVQVPGWRKTQNVPIRDTELSAARNATAQVEPMNQNIAELQKMIRQNGSYENSFSEAGRRMAALSRDIQLQLKSEAFLQLGVLAGPDLLLLESLIPDTTSIKNMGQANAFIKQLGDVKNRLNAKVASKMKSLGFEPDVPTAQPSAPSSTGSTGLPVYRPGGQ